MKTQAPIFIVGCPRSGTNTLYYRMAKHPGLAYVSNITKKFPDSLILTRLLMLFRKDHRPAEAKNVWGRFKRGDDDALTAADATPQAARFLHKVVANHLRLFDRPRFINKCPRNTVRLGFLNAVFPDAFFIHVLRDGRAVAHSILRAREKHAGQYWGCRPPGWRSLLDLPMPDACAMQWKLITEHALAAARSLPPDRYMEVRYEDLCERPEQSFRDVSEKVGLAWEPAVLRELVGGVSSRNYKWRENFSDAEIERLNALLGDLLLRLGYTM